MSHNKVPDCCVARIHKCLVDMLHFKKGAAYVADLSCDHCGHSYTLTVERSETLLSKVDGPRNYVVNQNVVYVEGYDPVESRTKGTFVFTESKEYSLLELVNDSERFEKVEELKNEVK